MRANDDASQSSGSLSLSHWFAFCPSIPQPFAGLKRLQRPVSAPAGCLSHAR